MGSSCSTDRDQVNDVGAFGRGGGAAAAAPWPGTGQAVQEVEEGEGYTWCRPAMKCYVNAGAGGEEQEMRRKLRKKLIRKRKKKDRKRQLVSEAMAAEAKSSELLSRISGRICSNGATSSACAYTQQGRKGINQDAMLVWENFASRRDTLLCGVFDGHGPQGHCVARRVRDTLPTMLMSTWKAHMRGDELDEITGSDCDQFWAEASLLVDTDDLSSTISTTNNEGLLRWRDSFLRCSDLMDKDLRTHPSVDCFCSGTTAVILLKQGDDLVIGNVGDSRAVLGTAVSDGDSSKLDAIQLTVDLKPSLPREAERIRRCRGRVFALDDEPDVVRVWMPYDDAPGLAMARAFGDFCLKEYGVIAVPDITHRRLTRRDRFVVLATDGVWDVLSNQEVVGLVCSAPTRRTAARAVVETAVRAWRRKYPSSKTDDCAAVCLFLDCHRESTATTAADHYSAASTVAFPQFRPVLDAPNSSIKAANTLSSQLLAPPRHQRQLQEDQEEEEDEEEEEDDDTDEENIIVGPTSIIQTTTPPVDPPRRSLGECLDEHDHERWSALEGVVRVNSILQLPRFKVGDTRSTHS